MPGPRVHVGMSGCMPGCGVGCLMACVGPALAAVAVVLLRKAR